MLEKLAIPSRTEMIKKIDALKGEEPTIEKMSKVLKKSIDNMQNKTQKSITKKATEDTKIESLDKKRKELRQKVTKTLKTR